MESKDGSKESNQELIKGHDSTNQSKQSLSALDKSQSRASSNSYNGQSLESVKKQPRAAMSEKNQNKLLIKEQSPVSDSAQK